MDTPEFDLRWILDPIGLEDFTTSYWATAPLKIVRGSPTYYEHFLSPTGIDEAFYAAARSGAVEELVAEQRPKRSRNHTAALHAFDRGVSLRIDALQRFSVRLAWFTRALEQELSCPVNVNLYLTPGENRALGRHYDTHDVFVLQLFGEKRWKLFDSAVDRPMEYLPPLRCERVDRLKASRASLRKQPTFGTDLQLRDDFVLAAGDLLYLPRGWWHEAEGAPNQVSCHLTVGAQALTYLDLLTLMLARHSTSDRRLRGSLPPGFATRRSQHASVGKEVSGIVDQFVNTYRSDEAMVEMADIFGRSRYSTSLSILSRTTPADVSVIDLHTTIRLRDGVLASVVVGESRLDLTFGGTTIAMPATLEAAVIYILSARRCRCEEVPQSAGGDDRLELVRRLVSDGLLEVVEQDGGRATPSGSVDQEWLPVDLRRSESGLSVHWLSFRGVPLADPFLSQTVARIRRKVPTAPFRETGLDELVSELEVAEPAGFVFHISRCGSTLLANGLRTAPRITLLSEPSIWGALLAHAIDEDRKASTEVGALASYRTLFGAMAHFARFATNRGPLVIKCSSWNVLFFATIRQLWPTVPCIIVVRDPLEVAVSCLERPPGWMRFTERPGFTQRLFGWTRDHVATMSKEEFCARGLGAFCDAVQHDSYTKCLRYDHLNREAIQRAAAFFGVEFGGVDQGTLDAALARYAKGADRDTPFRDDRLRKQSSASVTLRTAVEIFAARPYADVIARVKALN